jgi:hypothetical protein
MPGDLFQETFIFPEPPMEVEGFVSYASVNRK